MSFSTKFNSFKSRLADKLDTNGDGVINTADVTHTFNETFDNIKAKKAQLHVRYADIYDKDVKKAQSLWRYILTDPLAIFWVVWSLLSAYVSFSFYNDLFQGNNGVVVATLMASLSIAAVFLHFHYAALKWGTMKLLLTVIIAGMGATSVLSYAGIFGTERSQADGLGKQQKLRTGSALASYTSALKVVNDAAASGVVPESSDSLTRQLELASSQRVRVKVGGRRKTWSIGRLCGRYGTKAECDKFNSLTEQRAASLKYEKAEETIARLEAKGFGKNDGKSKATSIGDNGILVATISTATGMHDKYIDRNLNWWLGVGIESVFNILGMFVASSVIYLKSRHVAAAMEYAEAKYAYGNGSSVAVDQVAAQKVVARREPSYTASYTEEPIPQGIMPDVVVTRDTNPAIKETANVQEDVHVDPSAQLWAWKRDSLMNETGGWLTIQQAFKSFTDYCVRAGQTPAFLTQLDFMDFIREIKMLTPATTAGVHGFTGVTNV